MRDDDPLIELRGLSAGYGSHVLVAGHPAQGPPRGWGNSLGAEGDGKRNPL